MIRVPIFVTALLAACAPPPAPTGVGSGAPSITLLYPDPSATDTDGGGPLRLDDAGVLRFTVVVDFEGLTFVPAGTKDAEVEGEGHYHVGINGAYVDAPTHLYYDYASEPDEFPAGAGIELRVSMQSNTHRDLDQYEGWEDIAEFMVDAAR